MTEIDDLINVLSMLPGIGKKTASRISFHLLQNKSKATDIANTIFSIIDKILYCSICGNFTIIDPCSLCTSDSRDNTILCIIEEPKDLQAIEDTGYYKGLYHILMGAINPLEGIDPEKLRIKELLNRIQNNTFSEILIATNPTTEGEATFLYLTNLLSKYNIKISKLATGIPMGGSLEYSDKYTLSKAIQQKQYIS